MTIGSRPSIFFSEPQPAIEAAQALHVYELFNPAAVFATDEGYVYGRIREMARPPHETARAVREKIGYQLVAYCAPLLNIWRAYDG
jgi:hypothetical protein